MTCGEGVVQGAMEEESRDCKQDAIKVNFE